MKITLNKGQKLFFTSDTHYNHTNICHGVSKWAEERNCRPFQTLEKMNNTIVANINKVVGQDDILIHFGDWSFGGSDKIWEFRNRIVCKNIYLFLGNHDNHIAGNKIVPQDISKTFRELFLSVRDYAYLTISIPQEKTGKLIAQPKNLKLRFVCCHFPLASWHDMNQGVIHLHGHIHTPHEHKIGPGKMMDVGIDGHPEFRPYELNEVLQLIKKQPIKGLLKHEYDHHE